MNRIALHLTLVIGLALSAASQTVTSRTLVLLGDYGIRGNVFRTGCTNAQVRDVVFTDPNGLSVSRAFFEASYGKFNLTGDVAGPFLVSADDLSNADGNLLRGSYPALSSRVRDEAIRAGIDVTRYDRTIYVLPWNAGSTPTASGVQGLTNDTGNVHWIFACTGGMVYEHEIGHSILGSNHSNDPYDVMNNFNQTVRLFNAVAPLRLNWLAPEAVVRITGDGSYLIAPLERTRAETSLPQVYLLDTSTGSYALSFRQPLGVDRNVDTPSKMLHLRINNVNGARDWINSVAVNRPVTLGNVVVTMNSASERSLAFTVGGTGGTGVSTPQQPPACTPSATTLCLQGGRFAVTSTWKTASAQGASTGVPFSKDTGFFWFFNSANIELAVKVLDAGGGQFWVFYGGLTDQEYSITVTDLWATPQRIEKYTNVAGNTCGGADTQFGTPGASTIGTKPQITRGTGAPSICRADADTLCLDTGTAVIKVETSFASGGPSSPAPGGMLPNTTQGGYFTFFSPTNVELLVKALDGTGINGSYWAFTGALSNVDYTVTFTNTKSGSWTQLHNPAGNYCGGADTSGLK